MGIQAGRDLLLKIGDGGTPPVFSAIGVARSTEFDVVNAPAETTPLGSGMKPTYSAVAGRQDARMTLHGVFKDSAAEAALRDAALAGDVCRYQMVFGNGDMYEANFVVESYRREGVYDGLEAFAVVLLRSGAGTWTSA